MAEKVSRTLKVLMEMRDDLRRVNVRVDALEGEVREGLGRVSAEVSAVATEVVAVAGVMGEVRDLLRDRLDQRDVIGDHERRLRRLEKKVG